MEEEEFEKMLERGYMTDEEFAEMQRGGEKAWDECEASRARKGGERAFGPDGRTIVRDEEGRKVDDWENPFLFL